MKEDEIIKKLHLKYVVHKFPEQRELIKKMTEKLKSHELHGGSERYSNVYGFATTISEQKGIIYTASPSDFHSCGYTEMSFHEFKKIYDRYIQAPTKLIGGFLWE